MADETEHRVTRTVLPLFPLQTVLLPGAHLPLHIFEPRYRQLTADLVTEQLPDRTLGVIALRSPVTQEVEGPEQLHAFGCTAQLREAKRLPDGRFDIVVTGQRRFRLIELDTRSAPYLMGTIEWVDDRPQRGATGEAADRLADVARAAHRRYCLSAWEDDGWQPPPEDASLGELAYLLAADCLLPLEDRQTLLEDRVPVHRLRTACRLLNREAGFLSELRAVPAPFAELDEVTKPSPN